MLERSEIKCSSKGSTPFPSHLFNKKTLHEKPHTNLALCMPNSLKVPASKV